jgi:hypothetical protein
LSRRLSGARQKPERKESLEVGVSCKQKEAEKPNEKKRSQEEEQNGSTHAASQRHA